MKKNLLAKTILFATIALMAAFGARADVAEGDIYSIDLVNDPDYGGIIPTEKSPLTIGQKAVIRVRLINKVPGTPGGNWKFVGTPGAVAFPPQLGIMLGGQPVRADYVTTVTEGLMDNYTDLIFEYKVKSGDLAMPALLMNKNGAPASDEISTDYKLFNTDGYWTLTNNEGAKAVFHFCPENKEVPDQPYLNPNRCISGVKLGLFVKTVDFDKNYAEPPETEYETGVWRKIHRNMTSTTQYGLPTVLVDGKAEEACTMYVWVKDEDIACPLTSDGAESVDGRMLLTVSVPKGESSVPFRLKGLKNGTTEVRMSSSRNLVYDDMGHLVENWVSRTIQVVDPPKPFASIEITDVASKPLTKSTITCTSNYEDPVALMTVSLSQAPAETVVVKLGATFKDKDGNSEKSSKIFDYLGISTSPDGSPWLGTTASVTFEAGDSNPQKTLYLYAKGTTSKLASEGVKFTPIPEGSPEFEPKESESHFYNLIIKHCTPVITSPTSADKITDAVAGVSYPVTLTISDSFNNLKGGDNYQVNYRVKQAGTTGSWVILDDVLIDDSEIGEATIDVDFDIEGEGTLEIYIAKNPEGKASAHINIPITVAAAKKAWATLDREDGIYAEGETAKVIFHLSEQYGSKPVYGFLVPYNEDARSGKITSELIPTDELPNPKSHAIILGNSTDSSTNPVDIKIEDGAATAMYQVFICTQEEYDKDKTANFASDIITIRGTNVEPTIKSVSIGGTDITVSGVVLEDDPVVRDITKKFRVSIGNTEPSKLDRDGTGDDTFRTQWKFGNNEWVNIDGNPEADTSFIEHAFNSSGNHIVKVRVQDKDMRKESKWSEEFTFTVVVLDSPSIIITPIAGSTIFNESQRGRANSLFAVTLSAAPVFTNADDKLVVDLASALPVQCVLSKTKITFRNGDKGNLTDSAFQFYFSDLDGTQATARDFKITAKVNASESATDAEGKSWADGEADITVLNEAPTILQPQDSPVDEEGNPKPEVHPLGTEVTISWSVKDVDQDIAGLEIIWRTSEGVQVTYHQGTGTDTETDKYVADIKSGTHKFAFQSSGDGKTITMIAQDKDGDSSFVTRYYNVTAAKQLEVIPHGPESGAGTPLSHRYSNALNHIVAGVERGGLGSGYVWVDGMTQGDKGKTQVYNCGNATSKRVKAIGFKVGDTGYSDATLDSYAYAFLQVVHSEGGKSKPTDVMLALAPNEHLGETATATTDLPTEPNKDGSYLETTVEAIFSKEYRWQDNCGDINGDGIPDWVIAKYGLGVYDIDSLELVANDLTDVSAYNNDADYLPAMSSGGYAIVPNTSNNWEKLEREFNAFLEIRGFGQGLNARYPNRDKSIPDRDFTDWEEMAFRTYFNEKGHPGLDNPVQVSKKNDAGNEEYKEPEPYDESSDEGKALTAFWTDSACDWTPENPTSPIEADTDKDGLPDGYEYWFWYGATVGYPKDGVWQKPMTGKRFNEGDIDAPTPITSKEIANAFNPTVPGVSEGNDATRGTLAGRDFDGDGLSDVEEFLIGTNPVQCDSDGDGMIDGWEVMNGLNPLDPREINPSQDPNNDGDFMAYSNLRVNTNDTAMPREPTLFIERRNEAGLYDIYITDDKDFYDAWVDYWWSPAVSGNKTVGDDVAKDPQRCGWSLPIVFEEPNPLPVAPSEFHGALIATIDSPVGDVNKLREEVLSPYLVKIGDEYLLAPTIDLAIAANTYKITEDDCANMRVIVNAADNFAVIHDQVYDYFGGFNPQTGWSGAVNSAAYNTIYEYRLFKYRQIFGGFDGRPTTMLGRMLANTTNPSKPYSVTYGDVGTSHANGNHGADTDGDGLPDGWELYLRKVAALDPLSSQDVGLTPDRDGDRLDTVLEFAGTESTLVYEDCPTIFSHFGEVWPNKFWPTDPSNPDTDGDGISDWQEGNMWEDYFYDGRENYNTVQKFTFNYDDSIDRRKSPGMFETCYRGGGLNPCSIDTDKDGLPDFWEAQFAGFVVNGSGVPVYGPAVYTDKLKAADGTLNGITPIEDPATNERNSRNGNGFFIVGGMDGTYANDAYTASDPAEFMDYRTGTFRDYDFDGDGLQNYQEYMVQAVRSFRYDDGETPLNGRIVKWSEMKLFMEMMAEKENANGAIVSERVAAGGYNYPSFDYLTATNFYAIAIADDANAGMKALYESADNDYDPEKDWNWATLGYFSAPPHAWDPAAGLPYGVYMLPPAPMDGMMFKLSYASLSGGGIFGGYVSTDPRRWDTDNDGMDDYWELYHGLNPIYGCTADGRSGRDVISDMLLGSGFSATVNAWTEFGDIETNYDFDRYPWLAGAPDADPDNDKIRNFEEAITGNMTSPTSSHTDPTPLWMTEPSAPLSVTRQSYAYYYDALPWANVGESRDGGRTYIYTFEGNEGYDTDNDWTADSRELTAGIIAETDPLVASDPYRRAAIYLGGEEDQSVAYQRTATYINPRSEKLNLDAAYDMFRQFTVECWVKPEAEGTILERGAVYTPATAGAEQNEEQWRANFRLELKDGKFVGSFDDSAAVPSGTPGSGCTVISRDSAKFGEWTHLALSYDGKELRLYVNGEQQAYALCSLIPANGIVPILQDPTQSIDYPNAAFAEMPGSFVIGARHVKYPLTFRPDIEANYPTEIANAFVDFFKGYVAEVRIWDGVRSEAQIAADREKAYTLKDVEANRTEVFEAWSDNAKRNDAAMVTGKAIMPPQLMMHYDFTSLPGAIDKADIAPVPGGFDPLATFAEDNAVELELLTPSWWVNPVSGECKSSVYNNSTVLPWIENTVAHLTAMDGSFADSIYWADARASYVPSSAAGYDSFKIPNSANPYGWSTYENDNDNRSFKLSRYEEMYPEYEGIVLKNRFDNRSRMVGVTDLLPLGGAFAKRESDYWDGQGAMTAWTLTKVDTDGDGVPDWYEGDPADYMRELVAGLLPDGKTDSAFRDLADFNGNGLPDWWEQIYGISGQNGHTDSDKDGLSNYVEYLLNEVYTIPEKAFDPINPKTNGYVPDAYVKLGKLYIADVFTDHDHIDDTWEAGFDNLAAISPYVYDANKDADGDGWTNYAEFQADTDPTRNASLAIDGIEMAQYPVPIVEAAITYLGEQNVNCPIVVQAWNCADEKSRTFQSIPDAKWTIGETNTGDNKQDTSNTNGMAKTKFVGMNPAREVMTHLSPGSVVAGSFKIEFKDPNWLAVDMLTGQAYVYGADSATWQTLVHDSMRNDNSGKGDLIYDLDDIVLGEINYATGAVTIDFTKLPEYAPFIGNLADTGASDLGGAIGSNIMSILTLNQSYVRMAWSSKPVTAGKTSVYYLGDADPRSADNNSVGHLKEGKNNFIVFADTIDANGKYDPGEPFGIAYNVDVGWNYGKLAIELTDTNPIFARYQLTTGLTDRETVYGTTSDVTTSDGIEAPATRNRVRVFRYASSAFNPQGALTTIDYLSLPLGAPGRKQLLRVLMDKNLDLTESGRDYIDEADLVDVDNGIFDADWQYLVADHGENDVISVTYAVMIGDESLDTLTTTNSVVLSRLINRRFDDKSHRMIPSPVSPAPKYETVVADACPTFKWWFGGTNTSYTAFKINLTSTDNKFSWTSGIQLMPPKSADGYYTWKLPFCVGAITPDGKVFANNAKYTWKISAYNAKFKTDSYSAPATFYMNVPTDQIDYGSIDVAVRYFGASDVLKYKNNKIRVQAFATPDFSGAPVAEGYVLGSNVSLADTNEVTEKNAELIGLPAGNYYVMAYIDTNNNGKRDDWESWGYTCVRDQRDGVIYTPKSVKVGPKVGSRDLITIYLDDCDTDQDALPDAWEWAKSGNLTTNGATVLDQHTAGSYVSVKDLVGTLDDTTKKNPVARGLASLMSFSLGNPMMAPLVMGVDPSAVNVTANGTVEVDGGVDADTFRITGIKVENGNVILEVNAKGEEPSTDASSFYDYVVKANSTVKVAVYHTSSMAEKFTLLDTLNVTITSDGGDIVIPIESGASGELFYAEIVE